MQAGQADAKLERYDRYVQRVRVLSRASSSRHRIAFLIEESLRLANLSGEDEGRIYYFRRLLLRELPVDGTRRAWLDSFQSALRQLASRAVHGADPRAMSAEAVFFHNYEESWSLLLRKVARDEATSSWFWPLVSGSPPHASRSTQLAAVLERMRQKPPSWRAASQIIFSPNDEIDALRLVAILAPQAAQEWLRDLRRTSRPGTPLHPVRLPGRMENLLVRAAQSSGCDDARTIWLAFLAVIAAHSSFDFDPAIQVLQAEAVLRQLVHSSAPAPTHADNDSLAKSAPDFSAEMGTRFRRIKIAEDASVSVGALACEEKTGESTRAAPIASDLPAFAVVPTLHRPIMGEPTNAAGLFFLLNVLRQLGIVRTLECCRVLERSAFVARLLQRLADHAGVDQSDAILLWVKEAISDASEVTDPDETLARIPVTTSICPSNLTLAVQDAFENAALLRIWGVAVRRWCWRAAQVTVSEVANRPGRVSLSRADLDVTLPLDAVDIRIRRAGLDLDPGWLPWFGRVVRFHYAVRLEGDSEC